jgi:hypothetical protein
LCLEEEESPQRRKHSTHDRNLLFSQTQEEEQVSDPKKGRIPSSKKSHKSSISSKKYERACELPINVQAHCHVRRGIADITKEQENASNQF